MIHTYLGTIDQTINQIDNDILMQFTLDKF